MYCRWPRGQIAGHSPRSYVDQSRLSEHDGGGPTSSAEQRLLVACGYDEIDEVRRLLNDADVEVDINYTDPKTRDTPLTIAVRHRHWAVTRLLLQTNRVMAEPPNLGQINPGTGDNNKPTTPLMYATQAGNYEIVVRLIGAGADINRGDRKGDTALMMACRGDHIRIVETLLCCGNGVKVDAANHRNQVALHEAAKVGGAHSVGALVSAGARLATRDVYGNTALMYACQSGHEAIVPILASKDTVNEANSAGRSALHLACSHGHTSIVLLLLSCGANPRAVDAAGDTPLLAAIGKRGQGRRTALLVLRHLLQVGHDLPSGLLAAVATSGRLGKTALHHACLYGYRDAFNLIVQAIGGGVKEIGGEVKEIRGRDEEIGEESAATKGNGEEDEDRAEGMRNEREIDEFLNAIDINGGTALSLAVQGGDVDIVEQLLKMNCKLRGSDEIHDDGDCSTNRRGNVSLVKVAWRDHGPPMVPMLLSAGAQPCSRDASQLPRLRAVQFHEARRVTPQRLQWWARVAVRRALRSRPQGADVASLPLPTVLKRYLAYAEYVV